MLSRLNWKYFVLVLLVGCRQTIVNEDYIQWNVYHGDKTASHYSSLDQINKHNINDLKLTWTWEADDQAASTTIQCNPIIIKNRMFIISPGLKLIALQADTGVELWRYDNFQEEIKGGTSRGVAYWTDGKEERIFYACGSFLLAINAATGELITSFGNGGKVDLHQGLSEEVENLAVSSTSPGIIYQDLVIMGSRVGEGPEPSAPGHIRAFNIITGELEWTFHTIPSPGELFANTWNQTRLSEIGGANCWSGFSLDAKRGMLFCGTGSASYDHWGGNREGTNLYANCVLALEASTGTYIWHYQVVHHDIWDYDIACQPNLVQVYDNGKLIDAIAQPTKMGHLFVLDRETGEPIFPVSEEPVPISEIPGEFSWPTQPFPVEGLRYGTQQFQRADITDISDDATQVVTEKTKNFVFGNIFLPPGKNPTITIPQFNGGTDWGGAAFDPIDRTLIVNCSNEAEWINMIPSKPTSSISKYDLGQQLYRSLCKTCHDNRTLNELVPSFGQQRTALLTQSADTFQTLLKQGKGLMPPFAHITKDEAHAIFAFIQGNGQDEVLETAQLDLSFSNTIPWIATGHNELKDHEGFPANKPPWGTLTAIDLDLGQMKWQIPLGTYPELEQRGLPPTGTFNMGGPIITGGGLVFIASTMDERFRAFDIESGEELWVFQMDAGGYATPATYQIDGKQYVVIAAGGGGKPGTRSGNKYYCFALRE